MSRPRPTIRAALIDVIPRGSRLLLGISGGVDSMVLLHGVAALRAELQLTVEVAHVDHALREGSEIDASFVSSAVEGLGLVCHTRRLSPPEADENIEAWGRRNRYSFFAELRSARCLDFVLTAHTADDVAETFLMRLISNKELRTIRRHDPDTGLLRPLLGITRDEVVRYAREFGVVWREDPSNRELHFLRNRVRHELVPVLKGFDERIIEVVAIRAAALAEDYGFLDEEVQRRVSSVGAPWGTREWLAGIRNILASAPGPLRWRIGENVAFSKLSFRIGRLHGERVSEFILGNGALLDLPGNGLLRRREGGLLFESRETPG